jgi:hypothetical protein
MHRNIIDRALKKYPFLKFDQDPYVVAVDGRLQWILDGYTTTDQIPYSQLFGSRGSQINYIRNAAKVVVDAYTGSMTAYAVDKNEPILRVYSKIFPGLISEESMPANLAEHVRYPDDLFLIQADCLTQYHVTNAQAFLENRDAWEIPVDRGLVGETSRLRPYFVQMALPSASKPAMREGFMLILPFTPVKRPNMSGWLAADCDPKNYGKLTLYRYTRGSAVDGPSQIESFFSQNEEIANINRQFNNDQSEILVGNLLVIPIGQSVMYAESLFLRSRTAGITASPELRKVVLAFKNRIVVGNSYQEALSKLLNGGVRIAEPQPNEPAPTTNLRSVLNLLDQADEALKQGNLGRYADLNKQAREAVRKLVQTQPPQP